LGEAKGRARCHRNDAEPIPEVLLSLATLSRYASGGRDCHGLHVDSLKDQLLPTLARDLGGLLADHRNLTSLEGFLDPHVEGDILNFRSLLAIQRLQRERLGEVELEPVGYSALLG